VKTKLSGNGFGSTLNKLSWIGNPLKAAAEVVFLVAVLSGNFYLRAAALAVWLIHLLTYLPKLWKENKGPFVIYSAFSLLCFGWLLTEVIAYIICK
jgi:hypothetical protein